MSGKFRKVNAGSIVGLIVEISDNFFTELPQFTLGVYKKS